MGLISYNWLKLMFWFALLLGTEIEREIMGFIMEFAQNLVLKMMEDPAERDRKFRECIYQNIEAQRKNHAKRSHPMRPYGFWTFERHNAQLYWDPQISNVPGRRDPYDEVLQHYIGTSKWDFLAPNYPKIANFMNKYL